MILFLWSDVGREQLIILHRDYTVVDFEGGAEQASDVADDALPRQMVVDARHGQRLDLCAPAVVGKICSLKNRGVRTLDQPERSVVSPHTAAEESQVIRSGHRRVELSQRARQKSEWWW